MAERAAWLGLIGAFYWAGDRRVEPTHAGWALTVLAAVAGFVLGYLAQPPRMPRTAAALLTAFVCWGTVLAARSATFQGALILGAVAVGMAGALLGSQRPRRSWSVQYRSEWAGITAGLVVLLVVGLSAAAGAVVTALLAAAAVWLDPDSETGTRGRWRVALWPVVPLVVLAFVGATNPRSSWLGPVTSHGPRTSTRVALTFDDGPNGDATLAVMQALDSRSVQGTFFLTGKAVAREPELVRGLVARGHLAASHAYAHDAWSFLVPMYPELMRGEQALHEAAGVCPRFFRPPHGTRTPFVALAAIRHQQRVVTWDVSAQDWTATDPDALARSIVERSRAGSIILLHDGLDGRPGVDRTVLVAALPAIVDGLRARGLEPVRLDVLLGERAYNDGCSSAAG